MIRKTLAVGIVFLFIITSVTPIVVGYNTETTERDKNLENMTFACSDKNFSKLKYYKELLRRDYSNDVVECEEVIQQVETPSTTMSSSLMDSPWPMQSHDLHHTGRSPYSTINNTGFEKWKFETDGLIEDTPIIDNNGNIYFGSFNRYLYCLYSNGTLKWRYKTGGIILGSSPAIGNDGTIYIGSWDDYFYAINSNGTLKWRFLTYDNIASSPAIGDDGTIYFGTMGNKVYALNANGTEKWHYSTNSWVTSDPAIGEDGTIYVGSAVNDLYAIYPNGTLRWKFPTGDLVKGPPSIADDGTIYIGSFDGFLYAIYPNGTMKWKSSVGYGTETNPSIGEDGTIYIGGIKLYAIYPNGTLKWSFDLGPDRYIHQSSPAISNEGIIYVGVNIGETSGGEIIAINPNGSERWRKSIANDWVESSPSIAEDGTVYVGSSWHHSGYPAGILYAFGWTELEADAHGPYIGIINAPVQFTGSASGGYPPYSYHWDFGDEGTSEEQNPTHEYDTVGNYTVTLTVTDDNDSVAVDTTWAWIRESNEPPSTPSIDGETEGNYGEPYEYTFISTDLDGDNVWYYVDWGDDSNSGWLGPYSSGQEITVSHTWDEEDTYIIRAKGKDIFDAESDWGTLEVTMPVNQQNSHTFLQRFPLLYQLFMRVLEVNPFD